MASNKYLDFTGLSHFLDKIKSIFAPKKQGVEYINGTQTAATGNWTGETADNELYEGKMIAYRLPFAGSGNATLNLTFANGTTSGAKNVYLSTSTRMTTHVAAGNTVILVYHEANIIGSTTYQGWWMDAYYNTNDSATYVYYTGARCGMTVTDCPPNCVFLTQSETRLLPTWAGKTNSTAATHTMTTEEFDPFGRIYYKSSTGYNAAALISAAVYLANAVDLRYAFNTAGFDLLDNGVGTTVYMVCEPTTNGKAVLHDPAITKTLPIEDDGLLYVFLGRSYVSTTIQLALDHPVYMFDTEAGEAIAIDRSYLLDRDKNRIVTETDPYIYRQTGDGKAIGDIEVLDKIVGGTVCWNQLASIADSDRSKTTNSVIVTDNRDGSFSISTESGGATAETKIYILGKHEVLNGHVYIKSGAYLSKGIKIFDTYRGWHLSDVHRNVYKMTGNDSYTSWSVWVDSGTSITSPVTIYPGLFDITQMFGSTIAGYIYSLEQADAGAGLAWFKRYFPNEYYAYNPGELISVTGLQEHKTVGFNLWDEEWETGTYYLDTGLPQPHPAYWRSKNLIRVIPGARYYAKTNGQGLFRFWYDADKNYIGYNGLVKDNAFVVHPDAHYMHIVNVNTNAYTSGVCINISDPVKNGTYEPYVSHSTALDPNVKLRGIFSLDSTNKLTSDGDIWTPDGKIERHYAEVDLGALTYSTRATGDINKVLSASLPYDYIAKYVDGRYSSWLLENYVQHNPSSAAALMQITDTADIGAYSYYAGEGVNTTTFYLVIPKDSTPTGKLVYELAEPVIEDAPTYSSTQKADPAGTEEFVFTAEVKIPVGHSTRYMLAPKLYYETQSQLSAVRKSIEGEFVSAKNEQTFTPTQQLQARENIGATGIEYIRGTQTSQTSAWTGVSRDTALYDGKIICYWLPAPGTGSSATLNLTMADGTTTGAIPVYWLSTSRVTTHQAQYANWLYIYIEDYVGPSGTHYGAGWWSLNRAYYADAYPSYACREYTSPRTKTYLYRYMLCFSDIDKKLVPANNVNNSIATTKTLTTESFDPFGSIYYYGSTTAIADDGAPGENTLYYTINTFDLRYSFNTGSTLTSRQPVYVVCEPQDDGRVKLAENPIVQTIPLDSEEDGLVYIYLGEARSTSAICLSAYHDVYKVYNGAIYNIKALMLN